MFYQACWSVISPTVRALWRVRTEGKRHIPKKGPAILASNHLSFLDHFVVGSVVRRQIFYISKIEHFERPIRRWLFERWGVIPLRRGASDQEAFQRSLGVLKDGKLFCIYPEATRSLDGKLHKGHTGAARLHLLSGAPIIPVGMVGTFKALPKGKSWPRFNKLRVKFGPPLTFPLLREKADDRATLQTVTNEVMKAIQALTGQDYVDEYQRNPEVKGHGGPTDGRTSLGAGAEARQKTKG